MELSEDEIKELELKLEQYSENSIDNINMTIDNIDIEDIEYKKLEKLDVKNPKKINEIERMDLYHRELKRKIFEKEYIEEKKKREQQDLIYRCGIKKNEIDNLFNITIPDPDMDNNQIKNLNKK